MDSIGDVLGTADGITKAERDRDRLQRLTAVWISLLAVLLAIAGLGGENASEEVIFNNIMSSDAFAWYQAKNIRQTQYELAADDLQSSLDLQRASLSPTEIEALEDRLDLYLATVARYESEPDPEAPDDPLKGEGKAQLLARAAIYQAARNAALAQEPNFDYAVVLFQIAIVVASVSIIAASRALLTVSITLGAVGTLLTINGFLGFFTLPF